MKSFVIIIASLLLVSCSRPTDTKLSHKCDSLCKEKCITVKVDTVKVDTTKVDTVKK